MPIKNRRRLQLVLIAAVFAIPVLLALVLGALDWQPGTRSAGEPVLPQRSVVNVPIRLADGSLYAWRDTEPRMTLVALVRGECADECQQTLRLMRNARITLNKNIDRLRLLYLGPPLHGEHAEQVLKGWLAGRDVNGGLYPFLPARGKGVAALLVESNGTALTHYPAGFDPSGLRKDLHKVIK